MKRLVRFFAEEDGIAMATAMAMIVVMTILSVVLIDQVTSESEHATKATTSDAVFQTAEAGINDYIAKLIDNPGYYDQCVASGESTRRRDDTAELVSHSTGTASCTPGGLSTWTPGVTWKYPSGKDWWYAGTGDASASTTTIRGYAYNLMITPPSAALGTNYIDVVSTGCKVVDPDATPLQCDTTTKQRAIQVHLRRTTPADFQYMMESMPTSGPDVVCWASTVYGKMYSTGDIYVCGAEFHGDVMAENKVIVASGYTTPPNVVAPHRIYDINHPDIRTVIKNKMQFSYLLASISQIKRNAGLNTPTTSFDDSTASAWRINFTSSGNVQVWKCVNSSQPEKAQPYCNDVRLSADVTLKTSSMSSPDISVNESTGALPNTSYTGSFPYSGTIYVGPSSLGKIHKLTYTSRTATSFKGVRCTDCTSNQLHASGEIVSIYSGGLTGTVPAFNQPLPDNSAIYTAQDAIISWPSTINGFNETSTDGSPTSKVNGQVTVASDQDILIAGDVHYASEAPSNGIGSANNDVLGLVAQGDIEIAQYAPQKLWFRAATMAVTGSWGDYACRNGPKRDGSDEGSSSLTFVGTAAYKSTVGCINGTGGYGYRDGGALKNVYRITDDGTASDCPTTAEECKSFNALKFLVPSYFPPLSGIQTVLFREMVPTFSPPEADPD